MLSYMDSNRIGPAGRVLAANLQMIRKRRKLTFAELSARTEEIGTPIPVLGLRRIERGERRVDFDDLLALAVALDVHPVNLMVPNVSDTVPYPIGTQEYGCRTVHEWISGAGELEPLNPETPWASPLALPYPDVAQLSDLLQWLPEDRRNAVLRDWMNEQYHDPDPEEVERDWMRERDTNGDQS
jgi:transcriptional regulator with XRE-family HTH domain